MQDNDLPQIGTPMQTDETRASEVLKGVGKGWAEVIPADREAWIKYEDFDGAFADRVRTGSEDKTCGLQIIARHRAAFAAPPAVEREEGQPTLADIEHRSLRLQGESANAHGLTVGEPVSEWIAGRMKDAADRALAPSTPTLHPSDREEGVIAGLDGVWAWIDHLPQGDTAQEHLNAIDAARSAILALSGSLAPANPTEKGEL